MQVYIPLALSYQGHKLVPTWHKFQDSRNSFLDSLKWKHDPKLEIPYLLFPIYIAFLPTQTAFNFWLFLSISYFISLSISTPSMILFTRLSQITSVLHLFPYKASNGFIFNNTLCPFLYVNSTRCRQTSYLDVQIHVNHVFILLFYSFIVPIYLQMVDIDVIWLGIVETSPSPKLSYLGTPLFFFILL